MTVSEQIALVNTKLEDIMLIMKWIDGFEWDRIPLNTVRYKNTLNRIHPPNKARELTDEVLKDIVAETVDGNVTIINTSCGNINSFILQTHMYFNADNDDKPIAYRVYAVSSGCERYRTVKAENEIKAVRNVLDMLKSEYNKDFMFLYTEYLYK